MDGKAYLLLEESLNCHVVTDFFTSYASILPLLNFVIVDTRMIWCSVIPKNDLSPLNKGEISCCFSGRFCWKIGIIPYVACKSYTHLDRASHH